VTIRIGKPREVLLTSDDDREQMVDRAIRALDQDWMLQALVKAVNIWSPTGEEKAAAEYFTDLMRQAGLDARVQPIDALSANAIGELGDGDGPSVMVFAPLDSGTTGVEQEEVPWIGPTLPPEHRPAALVQGTTVAGLAANNSKAHIVASIAAAAAIRKAGIPLSGRIILAFGAGGAPSNKRPVLQRWNVGLGAGCDFLLQQGVRGDFAIVTKPGFAVQWEEPGLCWFRIRVHGVQSYAGRKHLVPDNNPILRAARVIPLLEEWLNGYARRHSSGLVAPQGVIGAIEGGWTYKPAFTPAACDVYLDMRISPRATPMQAWRELADALADIKAQLGDDGLQMDCEMVASVTGPATAADSWIVQSCTRGWEAVEQRKHQPMTNTSGQTEAVIFRRHGIPTARVGLPTESLPNGEQTMGVASTAGMLKLSTVLLRTLVDTCTRTLAEVGLPQLDRTRH
jgi:succinyl-diaminopimelate desuccinylase